MIESHTAHRRAHVGGGRRVEGRRPRGGSRLRGAADLQQERQPVARQAARRRRRSALPAAASTRPASRRSLSHASYLINLATTYPLLREQSIAAFIDELDRARRARTARRRHPSGHLHGRHRRGRAAADRRGDSRGVHGPAATQDDGAARAHGRPGPHLGHRFEHLAAILEHLDGSPRVGVCLDTCHLVASGYDIVSEAGYRETFATFDRIVGLDRLQGVPRQRLEEAVRQPRRSPRAHRRGLPRPRAVPPAAARPALRGSADADRDGEDRAGPAKPHSSRPIRWTSGISRSCGHCDVVAPFLC